MSLSHSVSMDESLISLAGGRAFVCLIMCHNCSYAVAKRRAFNLIRFVQSKLLNLQSPAFDFNGLVLNFLDKCSLNRFFKLV